MIQTAIYTILSGDATLIALTTRISHGLANQEDTMPFVTFLIFDVDPNPTKDTLSETDVISVSVSCIDTDNLNVVAIAEAVRSALDGYSGTVDSTIIESSTFQKSRDSWSAEAKAFQLVVEFQIFVKR
jgi:hypothetical protein